MLAPCQQKLAPCQRNACFVARPIGPCKVACEQAEKGLEGAWLCCAALLVPVKLGLHGEPVGGKMGDKEEVGAAPQAYQLGCGVLVGRLSLRTHLISIELVKTN